METHYNNLNRKLGVVLQWINICVLLHLLDFLFTLNIAFFPKASSSTRSTALATQGNMPTVGLEPT